MYEGIDTVVLYEELAYEDSLPLNWKPLPEPYDPTIAGGFAETNLRLLQMLAAMEEHRPEKPDENSPHSADLMRLDLKINLLLDVMGQLMSANQPRPPALRIRFNAMGAIWTGARPYPDLGAQGVLELYLGDCLPQPLRLVGRIASVGPDGRIKARFVPPGEQIADLIEKLAFRRHRRQVAGTRQVRR
jgi:hypothetical protein